MFHRSFVFSFFVSVGGTFFLTASAGLFAPATAAPAPRGALGHTDALGCNTLTWVYPGLNDTTYRTGSDSRLQSLYISREHGAHQMACRFVLSPVRQWVNWAEIWVEKGLGYTESDWWDDAGISVGLFADSSGLPGELLFEIVECRPGQAGIPSSGGYLRVALDHPAPFSPPDTLWLLMEWPPDYPDLVRVGVDDDTAFFNAVYHVDGQEEPYWRTWVHHNFMVRLNALRYDVSCAPAAESVEKGNDGRSAYWAGPNEFIIARAVEYQGMPVQDEPVFRVLPGEQTCLYDTAVFAGHTYDYEIRSVVDTDTSAGAVVSLGVGSPFFCNWDTPQAPVFSDNEGITLPHTLRNSGQVRLTAYFLAGWMKLDSPDLSGMSWPLAEDSIPLCTAPESAVVDPAGTVEFTLIPGDFAVGAGTYVMNSFFMVADTAGRQVRYKFSSPVQVSDAVGVITEGQQGSWPTPSLVVFPNPSAGAVAIEFVPPLFAGEEKPGERRAGNATAAPYTVSVYNILGREVTRLNCVAADPRAGRYRAVFEGNDEYGNQLPSALYFIRVSGKGWVICGKLIVVH